MRSVTDIACTIIDMVEDAVLAAHPDIREYVEDEVSSSTLLDGDVYFELLDKIEGELRDWMRTESTMELDGLRGIVKGLLLGVAGQNP